ncbi:MAG: hypothetical protein ACXU86_07610 [Archangium sp.]
MSASITFDDSLWPLLIMQFKGVATDQQFQEYRDKAYSFLARGEKYVTIADMSQFGIFSALQRQRQGEWLRENEVALRELMLGNATIVNSPPARLALTMIRPFGLPPMPYVVVPDMNSAVRYVTGRLEESGLGDDAERIRRHFGLHGTQGST